MPQSPDLRPLRVAVADDNPDLAQVMAHVLNAEPDLRCVAQVAQAAEVLDVARESRADVLLLDLQLRGGSGLELLQPLAAALPRLAVIVYSGHARAELADEALRRGAAAFCTKAGDLDGLLEQIRRHGRTPAALSA